jgi:short-subunit dehydrogenase
MRTLAGKRAVVTGAGSGIGRALALELAERGMDLALTDLDVERLRPVADAVAARGRKVTTHGFDVADKTAWEPFRDEVLAAHGSVQLVVNNAGVALTGPFLECSLEDLEWQIGVNLWGVVHGCRTFLPHLLAQDDTHLVNVSSLFGIITVPDNAAYCLSKHAVRSLTEALEMELHGTSVSVSSVHPGAVATGIVSQGRFRVGGYLSEKQAHKAIARGLAPELAARRIVAGILADERRILVGRDAGALAALYRLAPVSYRRLVRWWAARAGRGRAQAPSASDRGPSGDTPVR